MWKKLAILIFLFYFFALLQTSFFVHFNLFGAVPDIVFVLYFGFAFFSVKNIWSSQDGEAGSGIYETIFLAIIAGLFLDLFQVSYLGPSVLSFLIIGLALRRIQLSLIYKERGYPLSYFIIFFITSLFGYYLLLGLFLNLFSPQKILLFFGEKTFFSVIYSSFFAVVFFYAYRIIDKKNSNVRQLKLFR